jgi:hypothetical protein
LDQIPYSEALAAFKRDCNENAVIAGLLREQFRGELIEPVLDVGAGSGELATLAFPDLTAILLDLEAYDTPASSLHKRRTGDFMRLDFTALKPNTIIFCHSATYFGLDMQTFGSQLIESGARVALIISNENTGILKDIADQLRTIPICFVDPFHVSPLRATLERKVSFSAQLACADFYTMAKHVVRVMLDLPLDARVLAVVEQQLRSSTTLPKIEIAEAIYCYRLDNS